MHATETKTIKPPSRLLVLGEFRAVCEHLAGVAAWPALQMAPRGDGQRVLVLPGLLADDRSTRLLRLFLRTRGYRAHGWGLGRNLGPRPGIEEGMVAKLRHLYLESGRKVSLVGWSLGGIYARILGLQHPEWVRDVISLGSPVAGSPRSTNAWRIYEMVSGRKANDPQRLETAHQAPLVPTTSIYSRSDGVVAWQCSIEKAGPNTENIEVIASHTGLGAHPAVLYAVADRLAQPEGQWKPFDRSTFGPLVYPEPARLD
ncbi:MAG: alpha/beta hydrolase [Burkholderiaceae bacterium]